MKNRKRIFCQSAAILAALILTELCSLPATAQQAPKVIGNAVANQPTHSDVSRPLAELAMEAPATQSVHQTHAPMKTKLHPSNGSSHSQAAAAAQALQSSTASTISATVGLNFEGVGQVGGFYGSPSGLFCPSVSGTVLAPPDTNAAVGDTQVVQWINTCYAVFDKFTGALIAGPFAGNNFWKDFGGGCEADNDGDIIIQWDKSNHRWLASQNDFGPYPYQTCIAVSQTADATGSYYRYAFPQPGFPDYPKWGLTRSVYYQTQNIFDPILVFGVNVCGYDAKSMLKGSSKATQVCIFDNSNGTYFDDSMLPADDDSDHEPANSEVLLGSIDNFLPGDNHVYEYVFDVNFGNPAKSKLAGVDGSMPISVPAFDVSWVTCVPQPDSAASEAFFAAVWGLPAGTTGLVDCLDTLGDRLMYRLAHSSSGGTQHFLVAHSVLNTAAVATRWYEFRTQGLGTTKLSLYQSGQTPDDAYYRWMGSVAMDKKGDIALGYSRSSTTDYPSIYYAGQTAGDRPGTTEAEVLIKQGLGSQYHTFNRWGDYSSMALDGSNSCTFWYTTEFYPVDGSFAYDTWIASLKFPKCH